MLRIGASYDQLVSSSEVVQVSTEGVEQTGNIFRKISSTVVLQSAGTGYTVYNIVPYQYQGGHSTAHMCTTDPGFYSRGTKDRKKLLNKYWSVYTELGDSFLENLQGLTTLKIYEADQKKADEMDTESQKFRRITMKVLMMRL